jgi:hypothetical protein
VYPTAASPRPLRVLRTRRAGIASWWGAHTVRQVMRASGRQKLELLRYVRTASREVASYCTSWVVRFLAELPASVQPAGDDTLGTGPVSGG